MVDLSVHTAELLKACAMDHLLSTNGLPTYYLGFTGGEEKLEWANQHFENWMSDGLLDSSIPVPKSAVLPPATLPAEMVEAAPPQPHLNLMTWSNVKYSGLKSLKILDSVVRKYHHHGQFAQEFQTLLEKIRSDYPVDLPSGERGAGESKSDVTRGLAGAKVEQGLLMPGKEQKAAAATGKLQAVFFSGVALMHVFFLCLTYLIHPCCVAGHS